MDIADKQNERSTIITAVLTMVIIGVSLVASTWQTMSHQQDIEEQNLYLTTNSVLLAVESSLSGSTVKIDSDRLTTRADEFFQALERETDVMFVGILDQQGGNLVTSTREGRTPIDLPESVTSELFETSEWHGRLLINGQAVYACAKQLPYMTGLRLDISGKNPLFPAYLIVGIDLDKHLSSYSGLRQNALFQALYILVAALFTWGLGVSFLRRREEARKAASLERFQIRLLDSLPDGLLTLDAKLRIRSVNPAATAIIGDVPGPLSGKVITELPLEIATAVTEGALIDGPAWKRVSVADAHLEIMTLPLPEDGENMFLVIIRDRTRLRNLEQSLSDAEKLAAIGAMAANVAHEVRNPLSSLRGFAQYFVKKLTGNQPEEEYARAMVREADRLNRVITDLLFLSRPRMVNRDIVELAPMVRDISTLLRFDLEAKRLSIKAELDAMHVYADEDALKQAMLNLLLNSLEASPLGGDPLIIVSGHEHGGVWLEVRDAGCGMTEEQQSMAFTPFFTGKVSGTGLGLALVQRTMADHGGQATISTTPGNGCTVRLFFPNKA